MVWGATICGSILGSGGIFLYSKKRPGRLWGPTQPPSVVRWKRQVHRSYVLVRLRIHSVLLCDLMGLMRIHLPAYTATINLMEIAVFLFITFHCRFLHLYLFVYTSLSLIP